ncbi:MAG: UbiH/UbiF/VisC/COQ6 family ubiquinone biosynthesis hydroxylase [Mariprofundaceae bacterium]
MSRKPARPARAVKKDTQTDVLIIGGGMVGLALACALKGSALHVTVIERAESEPFYSLGRDCRVSAIVAGNVEILSGLGVWQHLEAEAGPMRAMRIWDAQHAGSIRFEAEEIGLDALGHLVENSQLQSAQLEVLHDAENVRLLCPAQVADVQWSSDQATVTLEGGQSISSPLIVGADGGRSWLRDKAGIGLCVKRPYRQKGIVATVRSQAPHRGMAFQRFLPTGPLAFLPMSGDLCSIVWSADDKEAGRLMALDDADFVVALNLAFGPVLGRIEEAGERAAFPLQGQLAAHVVRERLALIGDAAHTVHPLAGLGVNLGLRDAMVLAQELVDARRYGEDIGGMPVLSRYAKLRLPDVLSVMATMEGFHQLFTHDLPLLPQLRDLGMRLVSNSGIFKQLLMRNSTGISLPVPKQIS